MDAGDVETTMSKTRNHRNLRLRTVVIGTVTLLVLGIAATFLAVYVDVEGYDNLEEVGSGTEQDQKCDDISIIGAGVGGSYIAWRLRDRNLSVTVYEYSDRVGGRLHTVRFRDIPDINVELGAMRFLPLSQPLINLTAHALGLTVVDFRQGLGNGGDTRMYIRGKHFDRADVTTDGPYNLKPHERGMDEGHLRWSIFLNGTDYTEDKPVYSEDVLLYSKTKDGLDLYMQSAQVAYTTIGVSNEAVELIKETTGFYSYFDDSVSSISIAARNPNATKYAIPIKTIEEGMEQIPLTLMEEFVNTSVRHRLMKKHRLQKILKRNDNHFQMEFLKETDQYAVSKCSRQIILAVPKMALKQIEWNGLDQADVTDILEHASKDSPSAKVFLAYDNPWWRSVNASHTVSDLPNRQTYDFGTSQFSNRSVILAVYTDMEDVKFWREAQTIGKLFDKCTVTNSICVSDKVIQFVHKFLSEVYNISVDDIPDPIDGALSLWDSYPFGAAWHVWKPGYIWQSVQDRMIQPVQKEDVFISTGMFGFGHGDAWSESALASAELLLKRI